MYNFKESFGTTDRPELAGYIIESGEMLNFCEEEHPGPWSIRTLDHRNISRVIDINDDYNGYKAMIKALDLGLIRIDYNKNDKSLYVNVHSWPTNNQLMTLKRICNMSKEITVDFDGDNIGNYGISCRSYIDLESKMCMHCK